MQGDNYNLQQYLQAASEFLYHRFTIFLDTVVYKDYQIRVQHHWFRFEWQFRGSAHLHGFLWVENPPTLSDINLENAGDRLKLEAFWVGKEYERILQLKVFIQQLFIHVITTYLLHTTLTWICHIQQIESRSIFVGLPAGGVPTLSFDAKPLNVCSETVCGSYCLRKKS